MKRNINYTFYWRCSLGAQKKARQFGQVYYYFRQLGQERVILDKSTSIKCFKHEFDSISQRFVGEDSEHRNLELHRIKYHLDDMIMHYTKTADISILKQSTKNTGSKIDLRPRRLLELVDEYINFQHQKLRKEGQPKHLGNVEETTFRTYIIRRNVLSSFLKFQNKNNISIFDVDAKFCEKFDTWITAYPSPEGKSRGQLYATKCVKFVKTVMNFAVFSRYIENNLTNFYRTKKEAIKPVQTLSPQEVEKLETAEFLDENEEKVLDMFLFCHETLLHYGDFIELTDKHIRTDRDGQKWIMKTRKKAQEENRQIAKIPLSDKANEIINKYGGIENMPKISNAMCSKTLKVIAQKAKINKPIMFKMSRSSAISKAYNDKKMRGDEIAIIAGWEGTRELKSYLQVDLSNVKDSFLKPQINQNNAGIYQI